MVCRDRRLSKRIRLDTYSNQWPLKALRTSHVHASQRRVAHAKRIHIILGKVLLLAWRRNARQAIVKALAERWRVH